MPHYEVTAEARLRIEVQAANPDEARRKAYDADPHDWLMEPKEVESRFWDVDEVGDDDE